MSVETFEQDIEIQNSTGLKYWISWVSWPGLFLICMLITFYGGTQDHLLLYFNFAYIFLMISLYFLERWMPHERKWEDPDGQTLASILHTLSSKGTVQGLFIFGGVIGLAELITPVTAQGYSIWPRDWPMWTQVILGVVTAEFGLYWAHRAGHRVEFFWKFHSIHHSVTKLWFVNTGRFHFIDSLVSIVLGLVILLALGAPMEVVQWLSVITAFIGMLTHCNVEMRFGPLSYVFNTPELHRWHHSKELSEGDKNFGENVMLWDLLFFTFFNEDRRPPADIGIKELMPPKFRHQIIWPFISVERKKRILPDYEYFPFE
jgi:sterol desaturase/sphingolipid hydroxylase (fatty acid hydroxylase superfamily)